MPPLRRKTRKMKINYQQLITTPKPTAKAEAVRAELARRAEVGERPTDVIGPTTDTAVPCNFSRKWIAWTTWATVAGETPAAWRSDR